MGVPKYTTGSLGFLSTASDFFQAVAKIVRALLGVCSFLSQGSWFWSSLSQGSEFWSSSHGSEFSVVSFVWNRVSTLDGREIDQRLPLCLVWVCLTASYDFNRDGNQLLLMFQVMAEEPRMMELVVFEGDEGDSYNTNLEKALVLGGAGLSTKTPQIDAVNYDFVVLTALISLDDAGSATNFDPFHGIECVFSSKDVGGVVNPWLPFAVQDYRSCMDFLCCGSVINCQRDPVDFLGVDRLILGPTRWELVMEINGDFTVIFHKLLIGFILNYFNFEQGCSLVQFDRGPLNLLDQSHVFDPGGKFRKIVVVFLKVFSLMLFGLGLLCSNKWFGTLWVWFSHSLQIPMNIHPSYCLIPFDSLFIFIPEFFLKSKVDETRDSSLKASLFLRGTLWAASNFKFECLPDLSANVHPFYRSWVCTEFDPP